MKKHIPAGHFTKFMKKKSNASIKEGFKQEKRKWKAESEETSDKGQGSRFKAQVSRRKVRGTGFKKRGMGPGLQKINTGNPGTVIRREEAGNSSMPLNKFIAHCGICSRRDAVALIRNNEVKVNGRLVREPGQKVSVKDEVRLNGKKISIRKNLVYILLNKPKDYITTTDDPQGRKTVLQLIRHATDERVYPVGRLDRNTSGVLLLTNDGELAQQLTHPRHEIKKVYHIRLDKPLQKTDLEKLTEGIPLEDGPAKADAVAWADLRDRSQVGLELHSGRNRVVRRMFEYLGYEVKNLDRVLFGGLTKKNLERGKWRYLDEKEIRELKWLGKH